jgi:translation initiation factor 1
MAGNSRLVYSTETGRTCSGCGSPVPKCRCATKDEEPVPVRIVARLRVEKAGRGGKTVTVVDGLPRNATFLKELCAELKRSCGTGGAPQETSVELQGDQRDRVRELLQKKGYGVKG